jgi:hypothetical protein
VHYANGRKAIVGDHVVGTVYNTKGIIAGTLVSLTPGIDSCSAQVEFHVVVPKHLADLGEKPQMVADAHPSMRVERGSEQHGGAGAKVAIFRCRDYTHAGNLMHVDDAGNGTGIVKDLVDAKKAADAKTYELERLAAVNKSLSEELAQARADLETIAKQHAEAPAPAGEPVASGSIGTATSPTGSA